MHTAHALLATILLALGSCASVSSGPASIRFAHLDGEAGADFAELRATFGAANPGYDVEWLPSCTAVPAVGSDRVLFVQGPANLEGELTVGDIRLLPAGEDWELGVGVGVDLLAFTLPTQIPADLPALVRPDWDSRITDTPGGCAEETGAYRRILLTWLEEKGPYVLHALNAHRVRITDSFSHYHPLDGGFDEIYLVQMAPPGARVVTSEDVPAIEGEDVTSDEAQALLESHPLRVGDLVYMPRGTMHRGLGGALVQVISVPGFVPNSEIGLDHHLRSINERLELEGEAALPFHEAGSREPVVK